MLTPGWDYPWWNRRWNNRYIIQARDVGMILEEYFRMMVDTDLTSDALRDKVQVAFLIEHVYCTGAWWISPGIL
jgi:hypothetical protein